MVWHTKTMLVMRAPHGCQTGFSCSSYDPAPCPRFGKSTVDGLSAWAPANHSGDAHETPAS